MSRLPTLATPGRPSLGGSPGGSESGIPTASGIPTPSIRRPRSSMGPALTASVTKQADPEMDQAFKDAVRRRPPSSLGRLAGKDNDPDTPTQKPPSVFLTPNTAPQERSLSMSLQTPRTPGMRPRTPSSIATPTSRPASRPSLSNRSSMAGSTTTPARRQSMASSTSTTPYRRPESRSSFIEPKWIPAVGDRVRLPSHGYEGTLRYLGATHIRDGNWAGVELEGGFQGKGRNDGSVDGVRYFECAANCGIFTLAEKLAPPTSVAAGPSRPSSVASHRSGTSAYSASGRMTPASERRRGAATPSFGTRSTTTRPKSRDDPNATPDAAGRVLANSTAPNTTNAARAAAKITEGSRASKYLGMTAKQLEARTGPGTANGLASSTSTTPKVSKIGQATTTPGRIGRPSIGGGLITPKARGPRMSTATEMMPPPPSPQTGRSTHAQSAAMEEELRELRQRNAELEEQLAAVDTEGDAERLAGLQQEVEDARGEAQALRAELSTTGGDVDGARQQVADLESSDARMKEELEGKVRELEELRKEMKLAEEHAASELEAGIESRREEVRKVEERAEAAEGELGELKRLVDELTAAGNQIIELNESKQFQFETQIRELEEQVAKANEEAKAAKASAPDTTSPRKVTAAEIDNETLNDQVKHLQNRIHHLEEQVDEARGQAETDSDAWQDKYNKARDTEKTILGDLERSKAEVVKLNSDSAAAQSRISELQGALSENQSALESARAEIEALRAEGSDARGGDAKVAELELSASSERVADLEAKLAAAEAELTSARERPRGSTGSMDEAAKSIRGYHHIVNEMKEENSSLKTTTSELNDEIAILKEEIKLLQEIADESPKSKSSDALRAQVSQQADAIKDYEREVSELESLIESKIYREDELETRVHELEDQLARARKGHGHARGESTSTVRSEMSNGSVRAPAGTTTRCELCEGPHDLDACPVFTGEALEGGSGGGGTSPLSIKKKKWCADCETSAHDTAECPIQDEVF